MSEHTPTPWKVDSFSIVGADGRDIGATLTTSRHEAEDDANAAFIVRCVNSHDALLAACEAAEGLFILADQMTAEFVCDPDLERYQEKRKAVRQQLRDALAGKGEGK